MRPSYRSLAFIGYVLTFHLAWACWPYFVYPRVVAIGETTLAYALVNIGIRLLVWVLPVWLYVRLVDGLDPLIYLKLRYRVRRGVVIALVLATMNLAGSILRFGMPHPDMHRVTWNSLLGTSFLVGFIEEIPYRGFILQKLAERMNFWVANLITSLLFLSIHLPGWLTLHLLRAETMATVFVIGFVMGIAFRYADSLLTPIIVHSTNNFSSFVLFQV
jgi:membrane protease YdiL (CAAX protease family)